MTGFAIDFGTAHPCGYWFPQRLFPDMNLLSAEIGEPPKDSHTERVPFSNITHHFEGESYGERTLTYQYELLIFRGYRAQQTEFTITQIKQLLRWNGVLPLHDTMYPAFFFEAYAPTVSMKHPQNGVYTVTFTFKANPAMLPKVLSTPLFLRLKDWKYPDINGSGHVTAADAAMILTAAENIAAGQASGLTQAQEILADADRDGTITEADALLVQDYAAAVSRGQFTDTAQNWYLYLQRYFRLKEAVY